jgi:CheY-like chemotaxis protein
MSHRLLVADDSLTIQKVVELILKPEGFEILALSDGEQAWQAVTTFAPEIVLADVDMPSLTGYELCERIREDPATAHIPVVLLTGAFEPFDEERARTVRASSFIIKPFETRELLGKVEYLLSGRAPAAAPEAPEQVAAGIEGVSAAEPLTPVAAVSRGEPAVRVEGLHEGPRPVSIERPVTATEQAEMVRAVIDERLSAYVERELAPALSQHLKDQVAQTVASAVPSIADRVAREVIGDMAVSLRSDMEGMIREMVTELAGQLRENVGTSLAATLPGVLEDVSRQLVGEVITNARSEIEGSLRRIVPEVAENLIRKEIEKITADL